MNVRLNLEHIRALCRLHPGMVRDALIKRIETEMVEACRVEGKSGWKNSLEELKERLVQGLLAWLPLDARSQFTTTVGVLSGFWLGSNIKSIHEVISCLSSDLRVRRSAYYPVVAHQHHHQFVSSLTLELCNKAIYSKLSAEQEEVLRLLMPVLISEFRTTSMVVDPVFMLFRKAKEVAFSPGADVEEKNATSSLGEPKQQHVKALLRVGLLACEASPESFATGDYVWHLAMTFAERFAARIPLKEETNLGVKEKSTIDVPFLIQELLYRCPLQSSIPLQAIFKRLGSFC